MLRAINPRLRLQLTILLIVAVVTSIVGLFFLPEFFAQDLYPLPDVYLPEIKQLALETGLPAARIAGTIRVESNWHPSAVSSGNARGLMQIIPSTGRGLVARHMPGATFSLALLDDPTTNIRLGSLHLAGLHGTYRGDPELALAAYNAGGGFAGQFVNNKAGLYQTAVGGYVRRVLNAEQVYNSVYHDKLSADTAPTEPPKPFSELFWKNILGQFKDFVSP